MSLLAHKYTPSEMSEAELDATFAAREHTVDYLVESIQRQTNSGTLSSYIVTGPRGAGKSTVIRMAALRLRRDPELSRAWTTVMFPEEQYGIASLRDFLAAILRELAAGGVPGAQAWLGKVESEANDEQSQQFAMTGLREITRQTGRRLVVFVENLNLMLQECLDDQMKGTLRRLLMTDPFMMIVGSSVLVFDSLRNYDEAFFNYFGAVPLDRLNAEQVFELLQRRAQYDGNFPFLKKAGEQRPKIRAIVHLSGGNPRLVLMLYELLSQSQATSIVECLRRLVDELTPLLKDQMESLPPQQRKIIHALMEKGGTAQPVDLVERTRLPLNAITTQLKRLKDAQVVELLGGGKGRAANYTVPDKLFAIWYQMRYLKPNRSRIERFVEVLRIWFESEEHFASFRSFAKLEEASSGLVLRETPGPSGYGAEPSAEASWTAKVREAALSQLVNTASLCGSGTAHGAPGCAPDAIQTTDRLARQLALLPPDEFIVKATDFLSRLAAPGTESGWAQAARRLLMAQPPEGREALEFLEPVCSVLEGGEKTLLDPLPPEHRDFALSVLARFEPERIPPPATLPEMIDLPEPAATKKPRRPRKPVKPGGP